MSVELQLYSKKNCHLCDIAKKELELLKQRVGITYQEIDIYNDDQLLEKYGLMIPVVEYKGEIIQYGRVDCEEIQKFLKNRN
ncbi:glutaredoxin family protein [Bacillus massiliigorillae]|uniref:glutaredoxin family protein n=1 Tax=Bacillus massiliigorillae TaxID=1243664 RepID=UPI0003A50508|nr:glutaredoxin family protein [Bacillus massiliigorillae]